MPIYKNIKELFRTSRLKNTDFTKYIIIAGTALFGILLGFILVLVISTERNLVVLPSSKQATIFYDVHKKEFTRIFRENRLEVPLNRIPEFMKKAIISNEDNRFYEHSGIDLKAIARAFWVDIKGGDYIQGGSTITQQLARNVMLSHKKTFTRKIQEAFLAINIERTYTKDEILERYLNEIYFGHGSYGVESASRLFFGKSVTELEPHQMALLAGLPKNPNGYSPYTHPKESLERRDTVIDQMLKYDAITPEEAKIYDQKPLDVLPLTPSGRRAAYFVDYIIQSLKKILSEEEIYTGGYRIYTTLDPIAQQAAEDACALLAGGEPDSKGVQQPQISLLAIDPRNGYIKAMIGGRDFANTQLNRSVAALRQSGSAIKPFVYVAAIDSRLYTPSSILKDEEIKFPTPQGEWAPQNYDRQFRGDVSLRHALEESVNIIAVKLVESLGPSKVIKYAKQMGLKNLVVSGEPNDLNFSSLALGGLTKGVTPLELTAAYSPLANQGVYVNPLAVLEVRDSNGNKIYEETPSKRIALSENTAYLVTDMLRGVIMRGTGRGAMIDRPAAGKTGTSSDYTNAWFVGYTPDLLASVWIGNDAQKNPVKIDGNVIGSGTTARIWGAFMRKALAKTPPSNFPVPSGIVSGVEICPQSGSLATVYCPEVAYESYLTGTEPTEGCILHQPSLNPPINDSNVNPYDPYNPYNPYNPYSSPAQNPTPPDDNLNPGAINQPESNQTQPQPVKKKRQVIVRICTESGMLATPNCPDSQVMTEIFTEGEEPKEKCNVHR
ncbi:MAG: PBP1A family penicillin-binding protein [Firmicutes bacterium]|nr:PBP1A family penicillin-binding protein [Bacillota bacterium]